METATLSAAAPYLIHQDYPAYSEEQHALWAELVGQALPEVEKHAAREYLDGFSIIGLERDRLPNLEAISNRLEPRTGWNTTAVSGFLPAPAFFEMLAARRFPATTWLRSRESLEYTPRARYLSRRIRPCADARARCFCRFSGALRPSLRRRCGCGSVGEAGPAFLVHGGVRSDPARERDQGVWERADQLARRMQEFDGRPLRDPRLHAGRGGEHTGESG